MKSFKMQKAGDYLITHLKSIKEEFPDKIKEVRGKGLLTAFEMHESKHLDGHNVSVQLLNHGVYAKPIVRLFIAPALTIKRVDRSSIRCD